MAHTFLLRRINKILIKAPEIAISEDDLVKNFSPCGDTDFCQFSIDPGGIKKAKQDCFPLKFVTYDNMAHNLQKWRTQIFAMRHWRRQDSNQNYP